MSKPYSWSIQCAFAALLGITGCYKATFYQNPNAVAGARHERWSDFFILGLVGHEHFDVRDFCDQDEVAEVRTGGNFATGIVSLVTIGIYTPRKVYVTCAANPGHALSQAPRRLELSIDHEGKPARARIESADGRAATGRIEQTGPQAFRVRVEEVSL
jgi:hypothetical protein